MDIAKIRKKIKKFEEEKGGKFGDTEKKEAIKEPSAEEVVRVSEKEKTTHGETAELEAKHKIQEKAGEADKQVGILEKKTVEEQVILSESESTRTEEEEISVFKVANEEYAVKTVELQEIIKYQRITAVPCAPKYLIGITSVRGKILPVIDLMIRLGLTGEYGDRKKIIVLSSKKDPIGALVSSVSGVFRFPVSDLLQPPSTLTEEEKNLIEGVVKIKNRFISVLNVSEIIKMESTRTEMETL